MAIAAMFLVVMAYLFLKVHHIEGQVGVCYGNIANNLPSEQDVINLYKSNGITTMRLYNPNAAALQALQGSGIQTIVGVANEDLQSIGSDPSAASQWVQTNVVPFAAAIKYIAVGNEIHPTDSQASSVLPSMQNILNAITAANLGAQIKVSTAIELGLITNSYPPSASEFADSGYMNPIVSFLTTNCSPLLVNVYPYFARIGNKSIDLDYALFNAPGPVFFDSEREYQNLFDAMVDGVYVALGKAGAPDTGIVVSETGWPSAGGDDASVENAGTYYKNVIGHVKQGTPLKPGQGIETYLFAMFDENNKPGVPSEQHFGLFTPDQQPKYGPINFGGS